MAKNILIVDDSSTIREIVKIYLMGAGFELLEADNGERALQLMRLIPVALVIADIKMPGMDGITFTRALRADAKEEWRKMPVILLTGEKSELLRTEALSAGATAFLQKPISSGTLRELISQHLPVKS